MVLDQQDFIIKNVDIFLKKFQISDYEDRSQIKEIKRIIDRQVAAIGIGGMATVIQIPDSNNVIKIYKACNPGLEPTPILQALCALSQSGNVIFRIPYTPTNKTIILAPNYITETLIGKIMGDLNDGFVKIKKFYFDTPPDKRPDITDGTKTYIIMEKLQPLLTKLEGPKNLMYLLLQIMSSLSIAQKERKFVHGDLHLENIMVRVYPNPIIRCYELGNGSFLYTYFDYDNVITDFGLSRCETKETILIPQVYVGKRETSDFYEFNEYLDIFNFLRFITIKAKLYEGETGVHAITPIVGIQDDDSKTIIRSTLMGFFNEKDPEKIKEKVLDIKEAGNWRANIDKLYKYNGRLSNPNELFVKIATFILTQVIKPVASKDPDEILTYIKTNNFYVSDTQITLPKDQNVVFTPFISKYTPFYRRNLAPVINNSEIIVEDNCIVITIINNLDTIDRAKTISRNRKRYNLVVPKSITDQTNDFSKQYIFMCRIDQDIALKKGYTFKLDCCRVDTRDYFIETKFNSGVVINSVFFKISSNMIPIGYYKTKDIIFNEPIPSEYMKDYGILAIDYDGKIKIDIYENYLNYEQVLSCGAMLIKGENAVFTDEKMYEIDTSTNIFKYISEKMDPGKESTAYDYGIIRSTDNIKPGELLHAGNPNPRTVIGIDRKNMIYMFRIEGRDNRGAGMDFVQLCQLCKLFNITNALNLDGGASSRMVWKKTGENIINISGSSLDAYPVGGVLSFTK